MLHLLSKDITSISYLSEKIIYFMAVEDYVLTTKIVDEIQRKENLGKKISRHEVLWFQNTRQVRRPYITFAMTDDEFEEYLKCCLGRDRHCYWPFP